MNFKVGDKVRIKRDLIRKEEVYAEKGQAGVVWAIFANTTRPRANRRLRDLKHRTWYAQVLLYEDGSLRTVRLTSIEHGGSFEKSRR